MIPMRCSAWNRRPAVPLNCAGRPRRPPASNPDGLPRFMSSATKCRLPEAVWSRGNGVTLTDAGQIRRTLDAYEQAFDAAGVASAWPRVMAIVVQPGVEFGDERIVAYRSERARRCPPSMRGFPAL
jgi:D-tagatose-1,6-bisphosphate aldolase subunit GatZ/KbaZ